MKLLAANLSNLSHRLMAVVLTVGLSVCCCQTHLLFAGDSDATDGVVATAVESCCESCPDDTPANQQPAPCGTCCIKGTGLKDKTALAQPASDVFLKLALPSVVLPVVAPAPPALLTLVDTTRLRVEPRTLVRLRCALIV